MKTLSSRLGVQTPPSFAAIASVSDDNYIVDSADQLADDNLLHKLESEEAENIAAIESTLSAIDLLNNVLEDGTKPAIAKVIFERALAHSGLTDEDALNRTVGCESASTPEKLGVEAFESGKRLISDIIKVIIEAYKDFKAILKRTWARTFGRAKRISSGWSTVITKAEKAMVDGMAPANSDKLTVKSGSEWLVAGTSGNKSPKTPEAWKDILSFVGTNIPNFFNELDGFLELDIDDVDDDKAVAAKSTSEMLMGLAGTLPPFDTGRNITVSLGSELLGRKVFLYESKFDKSTIKTKLDEVFGNDVPNDVAEKTFKLRKEVLASQSIKVASSNIKLDSLDEVKTDLPSLNEVVELAKAHVELMARVTKFNSSKDLNRVEKLLDKYVNDAEASIKKAEGDTPADKRVATAKAQMISTYASVTRKISLGLASDMCRYAADLSAGHYGVVKLALGKYKKAA